MKPCSHHSVPAFGRGTCTCIYVCRYTFSVIHFRYLPHFLQHLNSVRPGVIRFTYKTEESGSLPFLDVFVTRGENGNLTTNIFRKAAHPDQLLNFNCHHPMLVKRSVVSTLTRRGQQIPSTPNNKKQEKQYLEKRLQM